MSAPTPAPILTTDRLLLAGPGPADLDDAAAMWSHPAVYGPIGGRAVTREEVWHRVLRYIGHWQAVGFGTWTVRDRAGGAYLGEVGLMDSRRDTDPVFEGVAEAGWAFAPHAHGRGFAAEALGAMLGWADARGIGRTVCMIAPDNLRSARLALGQGYRPWTPGCYRGQPTDLYERP